MGWKGTLRSVNASLKRMERESQRRQKELERQRKEIAKMEELQQAAFEVEVYENYISKIQSLHLESIEKVNWEKIIDLEEPVKPIFDVTEINILKAKLENFKPSFFQKLFKREEKSKINLKEKIEKLEEKEEQNLKQKLVNYEEELITVSEKKVLAKKILELDSNTLKETLDELISIDEINELCKKTIYTINGDVAIFEIHAHSEDIVPQEVKSLLKSGKLSTKKMSKGMFYEIFQDYICSLVLRVANETFSIIPIEKVLVNVKDEVLNTSTGYKEYKTILSVLLVRETFEQLNLEYIDPSDSMGNFLHNMKFKKTKGFEVVSDISMDF